MLREDGEFKSVVGRKRHVISITLDKNLGYQNSTIFIYCLKGDLMRNRIKRNRIKKHLTFKNLWIEYLTNTLTSCYKKPKSSNSQK